jgi:hypothetical protein
MSDGLADEVRRLAEDAVETARAWFGGRRELDFSEQSLAVVEELLDDASDVTDLPDDAAQRMVEQFGCYVLEVGRRAYGGRYQWYDARSAPVLIVGEPEFRVAILTWDKVRGRLGGDEADNIPFHYDGFAQRVRSAQPGVDVLYV